MSIDKEHTNPSEVASREAAERLNHFLTYLSHEIRGPLGAILGYTDMISGYCQTEAERKQYLERIRRSGESLLQLLNRVLDYSNAEVGKLSLEPVPFSLRRLIRETISSLEGRAAKKGLRLEVVDTLVSSDRVNTDPQRLRQILSTVIENAIEHTLGGQVTVSLREASGELPKVAIEIADTGIGLNAEAVSSLFRPFNRSENGVSWKTRGTGLNLSVARRIARALGGDLVLLESEPNKGSKFLITFHAGNEHKTTAGVTRDLQGIRVLLAEGSADCREPIRRLLRNRGAEVDLAENGSEAVEKAMSAVYDVIVMDMKMPIVSGYKATRNLRSRGNKTPVIAIGGRASAEDQAYAREVGCDAFLAKPFEARELASLILDAKPR